MKKLFLIPVILLISSVAFSQRSGIIKKDLPQAEIDRIIKTLANNEGEFRQALTNYVFNRKAIIQTVGMGGQITGEYRRESFMTFTSDGKRFEKITFFPMPTLKDLQMTNEDLEDLGGVNPFALEPSVISLYNFTYLGKEKIDELDLYVFEVSPKVLPNPDKSSQRMFTGRIWVDDRDLMIVKSKGKAVPETKRNKFPIVETWRENVDGKYWFPALATSDDELVWDNGFSVKLRMRVKYNGYAQGRSEIRVLDDPEEMPKPTPAPKKP